MKMGSEEDKEKKESESVAGGVLKSIGKIIPGLGGVIKSLEKSPAFKEKLKEVDRELERKIEGGASRIPSGIPPGVRGSTVRRKSFAKQRSEAEPLPPSTPQERPADIFDEEDHIKVIAEIPGVKEKDIKIDLEKDDLTMSVNIPGYKYHWELKLPCEPKGTLEESYKNGILEVKIKK